MKIERAKLLSALSKGVEESADLRQFLKSRDRRVYAPRNPQTAGLLAVVRQRFRFYVAPPTAGNFPSCPQTAANWWTIARTPACCLDEQRLVGLGADDGLEISSFAIQLQRPRLKRKGLFKEFFNGSRV
jgi:hypothetical protein